MRPPILPLILCAGLTLAGCSQTAQKQPVAPSDLALHQGGLAILTPTAAAGQDEDRQAVASQLSETLARLRPDLAVAPLTRTLSAVNEAGLAATYDHMYGAYKNTGLLDGQDLRKVAQAVGARYLVQLKIAAYDQNSGGGIGFLGLNPIHKTSADLRLYLQIWDSSTGRIIWEKAGEDSERKWSLIVERKIDMKEVVKSELDKLAPEIPG